VATDTSQEEGGVPAGSDDTARSSSVGASFNFINSIVGAGIVGMPFALKQAGFGFGIILVVTMGWLTGAVPRAVESQLYGREAT